MTGTLFVRADGTSCGASMVKMSADFPSEAPRCQRFLSITPQITFDPNEMSDAIGGFFSTRRSATKLFTLPLADPSAPPIISKREEATLRHECINLRPNGRCLCRSEVIVDHEPATVSQQVAVAIQVASHVVVRIKNKQPYFAAAHGLPNFRYG